MDQKNNKSAGCGEALWDLLRAKENPDYTQHNILQEIKADPIISMIFTVNFWTIKKNPQKNKRSRSKMQRVPQAKDLYIV